MQGYSNHAVPASGENTASLQPAHVQEDFCLQSAQGWVGCGAHNEAWGMGELGHGVEVYEVGEV